MSRARLTDFLRIDQLQRDDVERLFASAAAMKARPGEFASVLRGRSAILLFEKPSLRTRVSFEVGCTRLGGHAMYFDHSKERIGVRESVRDYAKNLERFVQLIVARVYEQRVLEELAGHAIVPVINALSNEHHPCQALADVFTLRERFGPGRRLRIAFIGDGNNVCHSLAQCAVLMGHEMVIITPPGHGPDAAVMAWCAKAAEASGGSVSMSHEPGAAAGADAVYTDEWVSMHQAGSAERTSVFTPYRVTAGLIGRASPGAVFMHCLPAVRGQEVEAAVIDGPASVVYDQAENRMHVQMAVMAELLGAG